MAKELITHFIKIPLILKLCLSSAAYFSIWPRINIRSPEDIFVKQSDNLNNPDFWNYSLSIRVMYLFRLKYLVYNPAFL